MATDLIEIVNDAPDHPKFKQGESWYYGFDSTLTDEQAFALFRADATRELKAINAKYPPDTGKIWVVRGTVSNQTADWWHDVGPAPAGEVSARFVYFAGVTGQTYLSRYINTTTGAVIELPYTYQEAGYPNAGLIDPSRAGGLPRFAVLLTNVPNGNYTLQVVNAATGAVIRSTTITETQTGPRAALNAASSGGGGNQAPTVSNPVPDYNTTVGSTFEVSLPTNLFADTDGSITAITVGSLPAGLVYTPSLRRIAGTPTQSGTFIIAVTGTDNGGLSVSDSFVLTIAAAGGPSFIDGGASETYTGTVTAESGMPTHPDRLNVGLTAWDGVKGKPINLANFTPSSGKRLVFSIGVDAGWLERSAFEAIYLYGGATYTVVMLEIDSSNFNTYSYIASDPNRSVQTFSIH